MAELFHKVKFENITLEDVEQILINFGHELNSLGNTPACRQTYIDKKTGVLKNEESLFKGQNLIYSGFVDNIFSRGDEFSTPKQVTPRDEIPDFGIREMFEKIPTDIEMPDLETEESAQQRRETKEQGLKIQEQMLSRLPISLAQLRTGNTSQGLRNEIRQLLYSLYRSKKLSKTIHKHECYLKMKTVFMNTLNSKTNESLSIY